MMKTCQIHKETVYDVLRFVPAPRTSIYCLPSTLIQICLLLSRKKGTERKKVLAHTAQIREALVYAVIK